MDEKWYELIQELCKEQQIQYRFLSKDWVIQLEKDGRYIYIVGKMFPLNSSTSNKICGDKYATYHVLKSQGIPIAEHCLIYDEKYIRKFQSDLKSQSEIECYIKKYIHVVVKDNCGSEGKKVFHCSSKHEVQLALNKIFEKANTAVLCPYLMIEAEYRVICLNGVCECLYEKERALGEWKHNLCCGANAKTIEDPLLKIELKSIAQHVMQVMDLCFASVDIIKVDGLYQVLEVNSTVCMDHFMLQSKENREIGKAIYTKAMGQLWIN